jgi:hypothetical protein
MGIIFLIKAVLKLIVDFVIMLNWSAWSGIQQASLMQP